LYKKINAELFSIIIGKKKHPIEMLTKSQLLLSQNYAKNWFIVQYMSKINSSVAVFWFRRDLRLEDNTGLFHALKSGFPVLPLFIFDADILSRLDDKHDRRVDFIHQVLQDIQTELAVYGSSLLVKYGVPLSIFEELTTEFDIKAVFINRDYEPYALKRDASVKQFLNSKSIEFQSYKDQVVFESHEVLKGNGEPYTIFTPYSKIWKQKLSKLAVQSYNSENERNYVQFSAQIPKLKDMGFLKTDLAFSVPVIYENIISTYDQTRNFPALKGTTELSVHLRFGTVSIRKLVKLALKTNETWLNELIWREFFMCILMHFPYVQHRAFKKKYDEIEWRNNETEFERWCEGKTGYPIVDAGMRQLNEMGWMHNRVRMVVASFLTKHLLIDWRWGEAYFAQKLLDYDLSANNGNWQWAAGCGCDAAPYFRVFNPAEQAKKYDPELIYIRKWVKEFDTIDYPKPIVEHVFARNRTLEIYKKALNTF
jgi:deoxyribodipyrimidine photo-lyase